MVIRILLCFLLIFSTVNSQINQEIASPAICKIPDSFHSQFKCFRFVVHSTRSPKQDCLLQAFSGTNNSTAILMRYETVHFRNVRNSSIDFNCQKFVMLIRKVEHAMVLLTSYKNHRRFFTFTNILMVLDLADDEEYKNFRPTLEMEKFIVRYSLNVVWTSLKYFSTRGSEDLVLQKALTNEKLKINQDSSNRIFDDDAFITTLLKNEMGLMKIRIGMFQCPPLVVYPPTGKFRQRFDGVEYRCFAEVTKNWQVEYMLRDRNPAINLTDPYAAVKNDLINGISDIALCSPWISINNFVNHELSRFYDHHCATFLVPKPSLASQGSYIYMALSYGVWSIFVATLIGTALILKGITYTGLKLFNSEYDGKFRSFVIGLLEVINIATSHGLPKLPNHLPIKILIMSWTYFVLLFGTGYSTGYTSLLTSPRYSKPIDYLSDFIEQGIFWGEYGPRPQMIVELKQTGHPEYIELAHRMHIENNIQDRWRNLETGKYGRLVKVISKSYITDTESFTQFASSLRLMQQCVFNYYTSFAFQKQSAFSRIFNRQISRLKESGIHQKWFHDITQLYGAAQTMQNFFDDTVNRSHLEAINLNNLVGAFYLLFIGLGLAFGVFFMETCCRNVNKF